MIEHRRIETATCWRIAGWGLLSLLLLAPLVAMQFTDEVDWTGTDFVVMGALLAGLGTGLELAMRLSPDIAYRAGFALAVIGAFLLIWINLAVGIIGAEDNPANLAYGVMLIIGVLSATLAGSQPRGLAGALLAMAGMQTAIAGVAIFGGPGDPGSGALELAALNGFFVALFLASAILFGIAARNEAARGAR